MVNFRAFKRFLSVVFVLLLLSVAVPLSQFHQHAAYNEGGFISVSSDAGVRSYRLFDTVTVLKRATTARHAYIGGFPVGISLKTDGVMVEQIEQISTGAGKASLKNSFCRGDMILSIDGKRINFAEDVSKILDQLEPNIKTVTVRVLRKKEYLDIEVAPLIEEFTSKFRLGLRVKDSVSGVGTVTFVKPDGSFGALGHPICNFATGECLTCTSGLLYDCKIMGYSAGGRGRPGELKAAMKNVQTPIGTISQNNRYGIFGKMDKESLNDRVSAPQSQTKLYEIGERAAVTPGKAQILTTIADAPELYDIEIIKASYQSARADKSMVIRVTDDRLLSTTGGVVQGMSGSPIIQNQKLIGAITHVFVNDPTKGYGIYLDWMY